jgi:hypothetical protein
MTQRWDTNAEEYATYVERHGEHPPKRADDRAVSRLYVWAATQRENYWKGKLGTERAKALESVPGWLWVRQTPWATNAERYAAHIDEHGTPPTRYSADEATCKLGMWAMVQKTLHRQGTLSSEKIRALEHIRGWCWKERTPWNESAQTCAAYIEEHGITPNSGSRDPVVRRLGMWAKNQKARHRQGKLTPEQVCTLESIPGWQWATQKAAKAVGVEPVRKGRQCDTGVTA